MGRPDADLAAGALRSELAFDTPAIVAVTVRRRAAAVRARQTTGAAVRDGVADESGTILVCQALHALAGRHIAKRTRGLALAICRALRRGGRPRVGFAGVGSEIRCSTEEGDGFRIAAARRHR